GVYRSTDSGGHWSPANGGIGDQQVHQVAVSPTDDQVAWAITEPCLYDPSSRYEAFRTTDAGATWKSVIGRRGHPYLSRVVPDPRDPDAAFVTSSDKLFHTSDGGETWTRVVV